MKWLHRDFVYLWNSLLNLVGIALPILSGVASVPILVRNLGTETFGWLTMVWASVGYASLLDLGFSRSIAKDIADPSLTDGQKNASIVAALYFSLAVGCVVVVCAFAAIESVNLLDIALQSDEMKYSAMVVCIVAPFMTVGNAARGILEGRQQFMSLNIVRAVTGAGMFFAPVLFVWGGTRNLFWLASSIIGCRVFGTFWMLKRCFLRKVFVESRGRLDIETGWRQVRMSGWLTAATLAGSVTGYCDRLLVGMFQSPKALAFYSLAVEVASRLWLFPSAITPAIFPVLVRNKAGADRRTIEANKQFFLLLRLMSALVFIPTFVIQIFGFDILRIWLGQEMANGSAHLLAIFALSVSVNSLTQVFFTKLVAEGHARHAALWQMLQIIPYVPMVLAFAKSFDITIVALLVLVRNLVDLAVHMFLVGVTNLRANVVLHVIASIATGMLGLWLNFYAQYDKVIELFTLLAVYGMLGVALPTVRTWIVNDT